MDVERPFEEQDLRIADLVQREGRALVLGMNKWDLMEGKPGAAGKLREEADHWLPQVKGVPIVAVSGRLGEGLDRLMQAVVDAYAVWNKRVSTNPLNRWFERRGVVASAARGERPAPQAQLHHAGEVAPAELRAVLLARRRGPGSYLRYLVHGLRDAFRSARHADPHHPAREGQSVRGAPEEETMSDVA